MQAVGFAALGTTAVVLAFILVGVLVVHRRIWLPFAGR